MKKALIAMSGGVDSSLAAKIMVERGYECIVEKLRGVGADIQKVLVPDAEAVRPAQ